MGERVATVFTPHGFTSRTSQPGVWLATTDLSLGAIFAFQCGARRSLSHVHQGVLGLGTFGVGRVDERRKSALRSLLIDEARWTVTGQANDSSAPQQQAKKLDDASALAALKSHGSFASQFSVHVYWNKELEPSNGKAWPIVVRALERDFALPVAGAQKKGGNSKVRTYTAPVKLPKAPNASHWLVFDGVTSSGGGEVGRLVAMDSSAHPNPQGVEPYYSLACYADVSSLLAMTHNPSSSSSTGGGGPSGVQQLRLYEDGWSKDLLRRQMTSSFRDMSQACEQLAHAPGGDELLEEIRGSPALVDHLAHWDGFEKDVLFPAPCNHDHHDDDDHHHHHGGHPHGQSPTRYPRQLALYSWLADRPEGAVEGEGGAAAAAKKKKKRKKRNKNKASGGTDVSVDASKDEDATETEAP